MEQLKEYLWNEWKHNNIPKYYGLFIEWFHNLTWEQICFYTAYMKGYKTL